jgi:hypothetical protein
MSAASDELELLTLVWCIKDWQREPYELDNEMIAEMHELFSTYTYAG